MGLSIFFYFAQTEPWMHVGCFIVGCWAGHKYPQIELAMVQDINEIRAKKGMSPLVGSNAWIKYDTTSAQTAE